MLMSPTFKAMANASGNFEITRAGIVNKVVLPEELKNRVSYDANVEGRNVVFSEGNSVYILTDEFGVALGVDEGFEANIFFVDGGMIFELISGKIILKGENGELYSVDEVGDIDYPRSNARIYFANYQKIYEKAATVMKYRYGITEKTAFDYVDNLVIYATFTLVPDRGEPVFSVKFVEQYEDLGLGIFQFVNYNNAEYIDNDDDHIDISELGDIEDEEVEEYIMDDEEHENDF